MHQLLKSFFMVILLTAIVSTVQADIYDLSADWSDTNNPNGTWTHGILSSDASVFTPFGIHTNSYINIGPQAFNGNQSAWTDTQDTGNNGTPEGLAKSIGLAIATLDFPVDAVGGHTPVSENYLAIRWTAPSHGTATIDGGLWTWADNGRTETASLFFNGSPVFKDVVIPNPPNNTSVSQLSLADATTAALGNPNDLRGIPLQQGDTIILAARRRDVEWFVGFNETINFAPLAAVPEPSTMLTTVSAFFLALASKTLRRRRDSRSTVVA